MKTIYLLAKKEIKIIFRKRLIFAMNLIILALLGIAFYAGLMVFAEQQKNIQQAQQDKRKEWLNQGEKHPHIAAHYGTFVFKPKSVLSLFDLGLDNYTGTSVYLEAHYQHEFMFRPAESHSSMIRFGELSVALVLQILVPLLIIFLSFTAFTEERESGTLTLLASQGLSIRKFAWGKILAYLTIVYLLLLLFGGAGFLFLNELPIDHQIPDILTRMLLLVLFYGLYIFFFTVLSVWISLITKNSRTSLLSLLSIWILLTIVIPKITANLGESLYPLPSMQIYKEAIQKDIDQGLDGKSSSAKRMEALKKTYLEKYQVDSLHKLPVNFGGISLQAGEEYGDKVHRVHWHQLMDRIENQNKVSQLVSLFNPYLALRNISMGLAATDQYAFVDFQKQVKTYRMKLIKRMNTDMAENSKYGEFYGYKTGKDLWEQVEEFDYQTLACPSVLMNYPVEIGSLLMWSLIILGLIVFSTRQAKNLYE